MCIRDSVEIDRVEIRVPVDKTCAGMERENVVVRTGDPRLRQSPNQLVGMLHGHEEVHARRGSALPIGVDPLLEEIGRVTQDDALVLPVKVATSLQLLRYLGDVARRKPVSYTHLR